MKLGKRINDQQNSMDSEYEFLDLSSGMTTVHRMLSLN